MNDEDFKTWLRHFIANLGWKLYVRFQWSENKIVQKKLTKDVADNLGYYLRESHPDFK